MDINRRELVALAAVLLMPGFLKGSTTRTPWQSEGPFYPDRIPGDTDNDLVLNGETTIRAGGKILNLEGVLVDAGSKPIGGSTIEIWQTDLNGVYLHSGSFGRKKRDKHFQGYGRCPTNNEGRFSFRTIIPVEYPGRTPHIHLKVVDYGKVLLTTQLYLKGYPLNDGDFLFRGLSEVERETNSMKLIPVSNSDPLKYETEVQIVV